MSTAPQSYKQLIIDGIQDLPTELLSEVVDFVYFLRMRATRPELFAAEKYAQLLHQESLQLDADEAKHLELEFADYEQRFPRKRHE